MLFDFHTHSVLSDGSLSPMELIRRAGVNGYTAIAITDHAGKGTMGRIIAELKEDCALAEQYWNIRVLIGVEITHVPPGAVGVLASEARSLGAQIVVVHGESPIEPVEPGTNRAAVSCPEVDILAHPGLITQEEAELAAINGIFLEITARDGHNRGNGHVVATGRRGGAHFLINSDAHEPKDLLTMDSKRIVGLGAGVTEQELEDCLVQGPLKLMAKLADRSR